MSDPLDRYRRQAKDLRQAVLAGETHAITRLRSNPPRADGVDLKHADYLHVIARENGYRSWAVMKAAIETHGLDRAQRLNRLAVALFHGQGQVVEALLAAEPDLADHDPGLLIALYDAPKVANLVADDPGIATRQLGSRSALQHLAGSRMIHSWPEREADMLAIAELMLRHGADVNQGLPQPDTDHSLSVLYLALGHAGNLPLARWLLEQGADPDDGESLYHATELGHRDGLRLLLDHGADPKGTNALPRAMDFDDAEMVRMLLEAGADPNEFANQPVGGDAPFVVPALHQAARRMSSEPIIDLLLGAGADPTVPWRGKPAYTYACVYGHDTLRRRIEAQGPVPDLTPEEALMARAARGEEMDGAYIDPARLHDEFRDIIRNLVHLPGKLGHIRRLVALGIEFDRAEPVEKLTPVQVAGWSGLPEVMGYLLSLGPDLSHVNAYGGTLLSTIIHGSENCPERGHRDHVACARMALEHGVALPRRAIEFAGDPDMRQFLSEWAERSPGSVVEGGVA